MPRAPALDPTQIEARTRSTYPGEFAETTAGRAKRALTRALGLTQFGVNVTELAPGAATALRHWHSREDEFVYVIAGEVTMVTDAGTQVLGTGMCAGFPAGVADAHCLVNRSDAPAVVLEVGTRDPDDAVHYPHDDLHCPPGRYEKPRFTRKDGSAID